MKQNMRGFTFIELMITILIVGLLAAIAIPAYQNYTRRAYYTDIIHATSPYKTAVEFCIHKLGTLTGCNAGSNAIPTSITSPVGGVSTLTVTNGVITVTPVANHGITGSDDYILTPNHEATTGIVTWTATGGGVTAGYTSA